MRPLRDDTAQAVRAAEVVRALAHPARLRLAAALCQREADAMELSARLGLSLGVVSRQLGPLLAARLVAAGPGATGPSYRIIEPALHGLVACMEDCSR
jgi:DNA-binding transcriptional ArsR family regulator